MRNLWEHIPMFLETSHHKKFPFGQNIPYLGESWGGEGPKGLNFFTYLTTTRTTTTWGRIKSCKVILLLLGYKLVTKYCTISNYSSRDVTCDRLDEFAPPARCIVMHVMWDKSQYSANPIFFYTERFICRPGPSATLSVTRYKWPISSWIVHIHWPCDAWGVTDDQFEMVLVQRRPLIVWHNCHTFPSWCLRSPSASKIQSRLTRFSITRLIRMRSNSYG